TGAVRAAFGLCYCIRGRLRDKRTQHLRCWIKRYCAESGVWNSTNLTDVRAVAGNELKDHNIPANLSIDRRCIETWIAADKANGIHERDSARDGSAAGADIFSLQQRAGEGEVLIVQNGACAVEAAFDPPVKGWHRHSAPCLATLHRTTGTARGVGAGCGRIRS